MTSSWLSQGYRTQLEDEKASPGNQAGLFFLLTYLATGEWPRFGNEPLYLMLAATIGSMLVFGQSGEEVGWRGYGLARLAARIGLARASIVVGIV